MLHPAKVGIFALMSVLIHVAFVVLFAEITLSFQPPMVRPLALTIMVREGAKGEIIQSEAAWPTPVRAEPDFSHDAALEDFGLEAAEWIDFATPDPSLFEPKKPLAAAVDIRKLAARAYEPPKPEIYLHLPPELKTMPATNFAIGPAAPEIFGTE